MVRLNSKAKGGFLKIIQKIKENNAWINLESKQRNKPKGKSQHSSEELRN